MALTSTSKDYQDADFYASKAGGIRAWVYTEVSSESSTQRTIKYIFGFDQDNTYSDNQDFYASIDGTIVYDETINNSKGAGSYYFYTTTRTYNKPAYGSSSGEHEARAQVSGIYDGPTSNTGTHTVDTKVPAKAGTVLGAPKNLVVTYKTSTQINYDWEWPDTDGVGPDPSSFWLQVATDSGFSNLVYNADVGSGSYKNVTGLNRATTYYARVRAINSVGSGSWSSTKSETTNATVPDQQAAPAVMSPTSSGFTVDWAAPNNGGSALTSYDIQISRDNFATVEQQINGFVGSSRVMTGLAPGVKYRARTRANNAVGSGAWSGASAEIQTLGGVKIWTGSAWGEGIVRMWDPTSGTWKVVIVRKWNGSAWVV